MSIFALKCGHLFLQGLLPLLSPPDTKIHTSFFASLLEFSNGRKDWKLFSQQCIVKNLIGLPIFLNEVYIQCFSSIYLSYSEGNHGI